MQYRHLADTGLRVSAIGLGSWLTYSGGVDKAQAIACIRRALDHGITLLDTANSYGRGTAETVLADALLNVPRESYVLATKVFSPMSDTDRGLSRVQVFKQLEASLKRLRTDYIDVYQCHGYDSRTPLEETMQALTDVVRQGKVRHIGCSHWPASKIQAAIALPGVVKFAACQMQYSLIDRRAERTMIPLCHAHGIAPLVFSPLAQGLLTGKYRPEAPPPADSRAASATMGISFPIGRLSRSVLGPVQQLQAVAAEADMTLAQLALAWVLRDANVTSALVGATCPEQIDENAAAVDRHLDPQLLPRIDAILAPASRTYRWAHLTTRLERRLLAATYSLQSLRRSH